MGEFFSAANLAEYSAFFSRHFLMCSVWVACFVGLIYIQVRIVTAGIKKISAAKSTFIVNHENGLFVDVRKAQAFSGGHIAGSQNVTAADIRAGRFQRLGSDKDRPLIVVGRDKYDTDTFNSARYLRKAGFTKVVSLDGGIASWQNDNLPLSLKD